jgi:small membrane protein
MKPIQFLFLPFVLFALVKVVYAYKRRGIRTVEFLFWCVVWLGTALVVTFPDATSLIAHQLGIGRGVDLIIYMTLVLSFYLIFRIHLTLDRLEQEITEIVRTIALAQLTEPDEPHASS